MNIYLEVALRILGVIGLSIVSAILYRLGGASKEDQDKEFGWIPKWIRSIPKKRDFGCGVCVIGSVLILGIQAPWWAYVLSSGLMWASLSSYWDWMFGYDNHWFHMFMIGLSMLPVMFFAYPIELGIRCIILAVLGGGGSKYIDEVIQPKRSDIITELLRGFILPITLLGIFI